MRKYIKPLLIILLILVLLYVAWTLINKFDKQNSLEGFNNPDCKNMPLLVDVNYNYTNTDKDKEESLYNLTNLNNRKYDFVIDNIQPFSKNEIDTIGEVKHSHNYVWVLNRGRNRLVRGNRKELVVRDYKDVFIDYNNDGGGKVITAWGVSQDEIKKYEYACVFVRDYVTPNNSYFLMFKATETGISLYNPVNKSKDGQLLVKKITITGLKHLYGDIYLKYNQEQSDIEGNNSLYYTIYCINLTVEDTETVSRGTLYRLEYNITDGNNKKYDFNNILGSQTITTDDDYISDNLDTIKNLNEKILKLRNELILQTITQSSGGSPDNALTCDVLNGNSGSDSINIDDIRFSLEELTKIKMYLPDYEITDVIINNLNSKARSNDPEISRPAILELGRLLSILVEVNVDNQRIIDFCGFSVKNDGELKMLAAEIVNSNYNYNLKEETMGKTAIENEIRDDSSNKLLGNTTIGSSASFTSSSTSITTITDFKKEVNKNKYDVLPNNYSYTNGTTNPIDMPTIRKAPLFVSGDKIQDLSSYYLDSGYFNKEQNIMGILDFKYEEYKNTATPTIKQNIRHNRRVIYTIYEKIEKKNDNKNQYYGRYNTIEVTNLIAECIPAQKFNYNIGDLQGEITSLNIEGNINLPSLYSFFNSNQNNKSKPQDPNKFKNLEDWVEIYSLLKKTGFYNINTQDDAELLKIKTIMNNHSLFLKQPQLWRKKHLDILMNNKNKIYGSSNPLKVFPNILVYNTDGTLLEETQANKLNKVYLHLQYKENTNTEEVKYVEDMNPLGDAVNLDFNFLKLECDEVKVDIDNRKYDFYKLMSDAKNNVISDTVEKNKNKFIWYQEKISDFDDFKNLILKNKEEADNRDRLRGIYELDDMYVDEKYIDFLTNHMTELSEQDKKEIIDSKKKIMNTYCVRDNGIYVNRIGYPFMVFYKYIDYRGYPCLKDTKTAQKIFLCNRLTNKDIFKDVGVTSSVEKRDNIKSKDSYPLIKQEFLSFSGKGNIIQYYQRTFGGSLDIVTKTICSSGLPDSFIDDCNSNTMTSGSCNDKVTSYVTLGGKAKCDISRADITQPTVTGAEVLVPGVVSKNACNVYILKGDMKIYYSLGKIYEQGENKFLVPGIFTVKNSKTGKYLKYDNGRVIDDVDKDNITNDLDEVFKEFRFKSVPETDTYGDYFLLSPIGAPDKFLTSKAHLTKHNLGGGEEYLKWTVEGKIDVDKRTHLNDSDYYSQKFNFSDALALHTAETDGLTTDEIERKAKEDRIRRSLESQYFSELATGDTEYIEPMTSEEEKKGLENLLNDINTYLKNSNKRSRIELEDFEFDHKEIADIVSSRVLLIKKRIENLKYVVEYKNETIVPSRYSDSDINPLINISNNNNNNSAMSNRSITQMANALQQIKNFVPQTSTADTAQCKNLNEGFVSGSDNNHNNNHLVNKYQEYVVDNVKGVSNRSNQIKNELFNKMKIASGKAQLLNRKGKKDQLLLSQELEKGYDLEKSIHQVKEYEQEQRAKRMDEKLKEVEALRCQLGDVSQKTKVKDHPHYNSIISREDGSLLNVYKINNCDKLGSDKLDKNMVFVNGGCLTYDESSMDIKTEHCMVNDPNQHFNLTRIEDIGALKDYNIKNTKKSLEKPHYVIRRKSPQKVEAEAEGPSDSKYSSNVCDTNYGKINTYYSPGVSGGQTCQKQEERDLCLHMEEGEISMRKCHNMSNQQWDYSDITGPCQ